MDEHFRRIEFPLTIDEFHQLPRNAAYKYEYFDAKAVLTPRPKYFLCSLDLTTANVEADSDCEVVPVPLAEAPTLEPLFVTGLQNTQPFASLTQEQATCSATVVFRHMLRGKDGPIIEAACFQALSKRDKTPIGALFVTLVPKALLTEPFAANWREPPPPDAVEKRLGLPHLTWVFVAPRFARQGIATTLLAATIPALRQLGFDHLVSTFMLDNGPSAVWHWRNGFQVLPQMSAIRKELRSGRV